MREHIREIKPASEIIREMVEEAAEILSKKLPESVTVK